MKNWFKTKNRLQAAIDNDKITDYLDQNFAYLFADTDQDEDIERFFNKLPLLGVPYWVDHIEDNENKPLYSYGSQGELLGDNYDTQVKTLGEKVKYLTGNDYIPENDLSLLYIQYISGYHESQNYGDILEIEGEKYIYIDSISLSNEMEHEAEDGGLVYEYRGYSFLRVLQKLEKR